MAGAGARRNNIIAGSFLVAALLLAVGTSAVLSDAIERLKPSHDYLVRFDYQTGIGGLSVGNAVSLGGQKVGRVTGIDFARATEGFPSGLDVRISIDSSLVLYEDAQATLVLPLIGSGAVLNITSTGSAEGVQSWQRAGGAPVQGTSPILEPGERLAGLLAPPPFLSQSGIGAEQISTIRRVIARADELSARMTTLTATLETDVELVVDDVRSTTAMAREFVGDLQDLSATARMRSGPWFELVDSTLSNIETASQEFPPLMRDADQGLAEARGVIASVQDAIDENRPRVDRTVASIESAAGRIDQQTIEQVETLLADASEALRSVDSAVRTAGDSLTQELPGIRKTLANLRLASDQAKLTMVEVRNSPWRLLYQPGRKELEQELEFGAARSYASAVSDLREASDSLLALSASQRPVDAARVDAILADLNAAFDRYQELERELLQRLGRP